MGGGESAEVLGATREPMRDDNGQRRLVPRGSPEWLLWLGIREALVCTLRAVETYMGSPLSLPSKRRGRSAAQQRAQERLH